MKKLTEKQKEILEFIEDFSGTNGMAPTVYEIADRFQIKSSTVFAHLKALQKKNFLVRSSKARSISLKKTQKKHVIAGVQTIPLRNFHTKQSVRKLFYDTSLLTKIDDLSDYRSCFAMVMEDDYYLSRGILPGDIAILQKRTSTIRPGDIVMAKIDEHPEFMECINIKDETIEFFDFHKKESIMFPIDSLPLEGVIIGIQRSM